MDKVARTEMLSVEQYDDFARGKTMRNLRGQANGIASSVEEAIL